MSRQACHKSFPRTPCRKPKGCRAYLWLDMSPLKASRTQDCIMAQCRKWDTTYVPSSPAFIRKRTTCMCLFLFASRQTKRKLTRYPSISGAMPRRLPLVLCFLLAEEAEPRRRQTAVPSPHSPQFLLPESSQAPGKIPTENTQKKVRPTKRLRFGLEQVTDSLRVSCRR